MGLSPRVLLLALAVVGLVAWLYLYDLPREAVQEQQAADESLLMDFDPARVDSLRVIRDNAWVLAKRVDEVTGESSWWLVEPIEERAETRFVENALSFLHTYRSQRRLAEEVREDVWARYGLSEGHPARIDIVVSLEGGGREVLHVGNLDPTGDFVFVRRGGTDVLDVAYSELADFALSAHHAFRRKRVFPVDPDRIAELQIDGPAGAWTARRDSLTGSWWAELDGERRRLLRWELDDLTHYLTDANVLGYQRDGLSGMQWSGYGLDDPWATLTWTSYDGAQGRIDLGNQTDARTYFARREGLDSVFEIQPGFESVFDRDPRTWIDENPIARNVRRAQVLRIEDVDGSWVEQRRSPANEKDWIVSTAQGEVTPSEYLFVSARNVALGLEQMQAGASLMLSGSSTAADVMSRRGPSVLLRWDDGAPVQLQVWWREGDAAPWVQVDGESTMYQVERGLFLRLRAMLDAAHAAP